MKAIYHLKKAGLLAAMATVLFTSCKKDRDTTDDPGGNPPPAAAKLKKVSMDDHLLEFGYGADGGLQAVKMTDDFITDGKPMNFAVTYTADKKINEIKAAGGIRIAAHYTAGELSTADMFDENNDLIFTTRYEYLNGEVKSATSSVGAIDALKFSFDYEGGNLKKTSTWSYNPATGQLASTGYTVYEYDAKTNPMHAHKNLLYLLLQNTPKNNITKEQSFNGQNILEEVKEYTYQYNNQSLPQSAAVKTTAAGQTSNATILFSYQ